MLRITIQEKGGSRREVEFEQEEITIGRIPTNDLSLPKNNVSKQHAKLLRKGDRWQLMDLGSTNGTYVNAEAVQVHDLMPSDQVIIGDFLLQFESLSYIQQPPAPALDAIQPRATMDYNPEYYAQTQPPAPAVAPAPPAAVPPMPPAGLPPMPPPGMVPPGTPGALPPMPPPSAMATMPPPAGGMAFPPPPGTNDSLPAVPPPAVPPPAPANPVAEPASEEAAAVEELHTTTPAEDFVEEPDAEEATNVTFVGDVEQPQEESASGTELDEEAAIAAALAAEASSEEEETGDPADATTEWEGAELAQAIPETIEAQAAEGGEEEVFEAQEDTPAEEAAEDSVEEALEAQDDAPVEEGAEDSVEEALEAQDDAPAEEGVEESGEEALEAQAVAPAEEFVEDSAEEALEAQDDAPAEEVSEDSAEEALEAQDDAPAEAVAEESAEEDLEAQDDVHAEAVAEDSAEEGLVEEEKIAEAVEAAVVEGLGEEASPETIAEVVEIASAAVSEAVESISQAAAEGDLEDAEAVLMEAVTNTTQEVVEMLAEAATDLLEMWGPLTPALEDDLVDAVLINAADEVHVERGGEVFETDLHFDSEEALEDWFVMLLESHGVELEDVNGVVELRLSDGTWLHAVLPPVARTGLSVVMRPLRLADATLSDLVEVEMVSETAQELLLEAIQERRTVFVVGTQECGRTTLLNALAHELPEDERLISIEHTGELELDHPHWIALETMPGQDWDDESLEIVDLLEQALRLRPQRVLIDDLDGDGFLLLSHALHGGLDGVVASIRAVATAPFVHSMLEEDALAPEGSLWVQLGLDESGHRMIESIHILSDNDEDEWALEVVYDVHDTEEEDL